MAVRLMGSEIKCFIYCLVQRYKQTRYRYEQPRGIKPTAYLFRTPKFCGLEEAESEFWFHSP